MSCRRRFLVLFSLLIITFSTKICAFSFFQQDELYEFTSQARNLAPNILKLAMSAYNHAKQEGLVAKSIITIIDYTKPSTEKRLWVVDLDRKKVLFNTLVAHGRNSGLDVANRFSNEFQSLASSIGVFLTRHTYQGHNGYSLIMEGLEKGFNDKAEARHIVFHPAHYVSEDYINRTGRIGRSWGCPALNPRVASQLINTIKDGSLVFAYYPDKRWLNNSDFLNV